MSGLDVVGDPLDEVVGVLLTKQGQPRHAGVKEALSARKGKPSRNNDAHLLLNLEHAVVDIAERDLSAPQGGDGEVPSLPRVGGGHHVLGVKHLLRQLGNRDGAERLRALGGEGRGADHEEVQTRERNHVDRKLAKVRVELAGEL